MCGQDTQRTSSIGAETAAVKVSRKYSYATSLCNDGVTIIIVI